MVTLGYKWEVRITCVGTMRVMRFLDMAMHWALDTTVTRRGVSQRGGEDSRQVGDVARFLELGEIPL